jgi:beta-lactamase superfamily II metal-dependent hydrolase
VQIDTVDLVIASHNHADHIGGMPAVFQTDRLVARL